MYTDRITVSTPCFETRSHVVTVTLPLPFSRLRPPRPRSMTHVRAGTAASIGHYRDRKVCPPPPYGVPPCGVIGLSSVFTNLVVNLCNPRGATLFSQPGDLRPGHKHNYAATSSASRMGGTLPYPRHLANSNPFSTRRLQLTSDHSGSGPEQWSFYANHFSRALAGEKS